MDSKTLGIIRRDPWLKPYEKAITGRHEHYLKIREELTASSGGSLSQFADGYLYFGLHRTADGWVFREWAPNATAIYLVGDFNGWQELEIYRLKPLENGVWELRVPVSGMQHGQLYKMKVYWQGGCGERLPAWCRRVVQDEKTAIFSAQVWQPEEPYKFKVNRFKPSRHPLLIYECHVGMAQDAERVGTYEEFRTNVLPRIAADGYNAIQIMAIQEHPYYGSFGYHVSNFFAPSSRFGTPDELKHLIDDAHQMGLAVIMDLVHSHAVRNENEGLGNLAGDPNQYFLPEPRRNHLQWDSLCFDYGKHEVLHFLLSNCKYWLDEFRFDGFRFDGVTSMIYLSHGMGESFTSYDDYFNGHQDDEALCYLTLANDLIHKEINPRAVTIAEEVSGLPGLAAPIEEGGVGFDYRMAMNVPDYWIKLIKEKRDEEWLPSSIIYELTNHREDENTVTYCESHDQALVGDKTIAFRLMDADMYWHLKIGDENNTIHRGMALHKMIRLVTSSTMNGAYLNFMGNEFGHPEWIDFPREGNGWSYHYALRRWNLVDNKELCYQFLGAFDKAMLSTLKSIPHIDATPVQHVCVNDGDQVLAYLRGRLLLVYNFSPNRSYTDYGLLVPKGKYIIVVNTDALQFGGFGLNDDTVSHFTCSLPDAADGHKSSYEQLRLYLPARSAIVLQRVP